MSVTAHPKYADHWIIVIYPYGRGMVNGKRENRKYRIVWGPASYEQAKDYERELYWKMRGEKPVRIDPVLSEVYVDFSTYYRLKVATATYEDVARDWKKYILPFFGSLRLSVITSEAINRFKSQLLQKLQPQTINRILCGLSAILHWCSDQNYCKPIKVQVFSRKQLTIKPKLIPTYEEMQRLLEHLPDDRRGAMLKTMYYAGLRRSDANKLTHQHVNMEAGYLMVIGKGNKLRVVPMVEELKAALKPYVNDGYLFLNPLKNKPYYDLKTLLNTAAKKAGITQHITHHTLRHAFGTHMVMKGANLRSIQALMGHSDLKFTEIYTTLAPEFLRDEIQRLTKPHSISGFGPSPPK